MLAGFFSSNTNPNAATSGCKRDTVLKSTGEGRRGTLLPCRTYSTHGHSYKTSGRLCGATNHRVDIECEGRTGRGSSPDQARDPRQLTGHARGRTCPSIMSQFGSEILRRKVLIMVGMQDGHSTKTA